MRRQHKKMQSAAFVIVGLLAVTACTTKSDTPAAVEGPTETAAPAVTMETGPGVTDDTITLGVISDLSGVFAAQGRETLQGVQLYWDQRNAEGGVCDRNVELLIKDHGYNTQTAVTQYAEIEPNVLAIQTLLGSPMTAALIDTLTTDKMLTIPSSWAPSLLDYEAIVMAGTPYNIDMANAVYWLTQEKGLTKGDSIAHIFLEGEYGESALAGTRLAAEKLGLKVVEQKVQPSDGDMTAQITAIKSAGAKYIMLSTTGAQVASAVSVAAASGFNATFVGSNVTFVPSLLDGPARAGLEANYFVVSSFLPFGSDLPGPTRVREAYLAQNPGANPTYGPIYGSGVAEIMYQILNRACENGNLTREGILAARGSLGTVETGGLFPTLNLGVVGQAPSVESYISRPDGSIPGSLTLVKDLFAAPFITN